MCRSEEFSTVANKQNERAIKSLHVFCTNKDKGCNWQGEINNITDHLESRDGCHFQEVKCSNNCGLVLQRQSLPSHVDNNCPCRQVYCEYCCGVGKYQFIMGEHVDQCGKVPLPCPNSCGVDSILREDMEAHKTNCPLEEIKCPNDCSGMLQRQLMTNHVETECTRRKVICQYCKFTGEHHLIEGQHMEECPKFPIRCPNECEVGSIPRDDIVDHRQKCPLEVIECEYYSMGCHVSMARKDQCTHEREKMEEHLLLTKSELVEIKSSYKTKISEVESELQHSHAKINKLESELQQKHVRVNELESKSQKNYLKIDELKYEVNKLESELQQNHALMKILFGEWTMHLNTRAVQLLSGNQLLPVVVRMPGYAAKKLHGVDWYSDPFYTHQEGYKMKLSVLSDGRNNGKGTHLSVYLYLMEGPYDDKLSWPLKGKFKVTLLNQVSDTDHHSVAHNISGAEQISASHWLEDDTEEIWYHHRFIKTATLLSSKYLQNDTLFFEVSAGYIQSIVSYW